MSTVFTTMRRQSQRRYDVDAWVNTDNAIEVKVFDHRHHRIVAHLVENDCVKPSENTVCAAIFPDERREIELGKKDTLMLNYIEEIDRQEPEASPTSVLFWEFDDDSFAWERHSLELFEKSLSDGRMICFDNQLRETQLERAVSGLRQKYMEEVDREVAHI